MLKAQSLPLLDPATVDRLDAEITSKPFLKHLRKMETLYRLETKPKKLLDPQLERFISLIKW